MLNQAFLLLYPQTSAKLYPIGEEFQGVHVLQLEGGGEGLPPVWVDSEDGHVRLQHGEPLLLVWDLLHG